MRAALKVLIVDDERLARVKLRGMLEAYEGLEVVGEADGVVEAARQTVACRPDVIFLDVQMPRGSGFDLLQQLENPPAIVFVTAHDEHAVRAFEVNAVDYLLKPVQSDRLRRAIERLIDPSPPAPAPLIKLDEDDHLFVQEADRMHHFEVRSIVFIRATGSQSEVHLEGGRSILVSRTLAHWEERLPSRRFARVHRSTLVNLLHVLAIERQPNQTYLVRLRGLEEPVRMSRRQALQLRSRLA